MHLVYNSRKFLLLAPNYMHLFVISVLSDVFLLAGVLDEFSSWADKFCSDEFFMHFWH